jgi:hypothetical protein
MMLQYVMHGRCDSGTDAADATRQARALSGRAPYQSHCSIRAQHLLADSMTADIDGMHCVMAARALCDRCVVAV